MLREHSLRKERLDVGNVLLLGLLLGHALLLIPGIPLGLASKVSPAVLFSVHKKRGGS